MKILPVILACTFTTLGMAIGAFGTSHWLDESHTQNTRTAMTSPGEKLSGPYPIRSNESQGKNPFELLTEPQRELFTLAVQTVENTDVSSIDQPALEISQLYDYQTMHTLLSTISVAEEPW